MAPQKRVYHPVYDAAEHQTATLEAHALASFAAATFAVALFEHVLGQQYEQRTVAVDYVHVRVHGVQGAGASGQNPFCSKRAPQQNTKR